ncbi:MAG TPA: PAS domain-containing protein [Anaerolineaceae bacterium]|nr:PAS domain-containing protein [Anaerolineaceae bacterium]
MKDISPITQPIFRRRGPNLQLDANSIGSLLNAMPVAAILVSRNQGIIATTNSAFLRLTAFSQSEISSGQLKQILPALDASKLVSGESHITELFRRQRDALTVEVKVNSLDDAGRWLLLEVERLDARRDIDGFHAQIFSAFRQLFQLFEAESAESALEQAIQVIHTVLETDLVCFYKAESAFPQLTKTATCEETPIFPELLPSTDLIQLDGDILWIPGKRVMTEVQRAGRVANLEYVTSLPLGQPGALFGLIVAGDRTKRPPERMMSVLDQFGAAITAALQHLMLVNHLEERVDHWENHRLVRDTIVENIRSGIMILDASLTILEMNPAAASILGYEKHEVIQKPVDSILIGTDRLLPALEYALKGKPTDNLGQITLHRRAGETFPAHIQINPVIKDGEPTGVIIFIQDISEHVEIRARTEALEQRAVIGEFTAMFAHEVRNPINNISTGLQLLSSRMDEEDANQEVLSRMEHDCSRLNHLMEELLAFSRPVEARNENVDVANLVRRIVDRWRPRMARKNIECFFKCDDGKATITADVRSLEQVFTNLITNAIEAMAERGGTLAVGIVTNKM